MVTIGIDIGSTTSKCVMLRGGTDILATSLVPGGIGTSSPDRAMTEVLAKSGLSIGDVDYTVVTGYGRSNYKEADMQVSELSCHAFGGRFVFPKLRTIIDIGGQDVKVVALSESGRMTNFIMNDKCAAGTGRFLDVMAGVLQIKLSDIENLAAIADRPSSISSTCTVFAESEVISQLAHGATIPNVVAGICESVASRTASMVKRIGATEQICMSGGVAQNGGVRRALEKTLGVSIAYSPLSQLFGALGAAIYAFNKLQHDKL